MYTKLSDVQLKTGEMMEIGVVLSPDREYADGIMDLLSHKDDHWKWHIEKALKGEITGLETRFYIGQLDGQIIANVMTVEYDRTGFFGHVYTRPEHRRKHACTSVMEQQMEDFRQRGGGIMFLGTGYNSAAYWIYHSHGFRSLMEKSGFMRYSSEEDFEASHFTPGEVRIIDVDWKHWSMLSVLASVPGIESLRSVVFRVYGSEDFGEIFPEFMQSLVAGRIKVKLLESESGAVVGCAILASDDRWRGKTYILDIFAHPNFVSHYETLLNALQLPEGKIQCYVDANAPGEKIAALQQADFNREARIEKQFEWENDWIDVFIYSKFS